MNTPPTNKPEQEHPSIMDLVKYHNGYIDQITADTRALIENHLGNCEICKGTMAKIKRTGKEEDKLEEGINQLPLDQLLARVNTMKDDPDFNKIELTMIVDRCKFELQKDPHCQAAIDILTMITKPEFNNAPLPQLEAIDCLNGLSSF